MGRQSYRLRDYGFDMIRIKEKLAILRRLLEVQLEQNAKVVDSASLANGPDIRHVPIGRDCLGNYYWRFVEGKNSLVVKELVDPGSKPFCQIIKSVAGKTSVRQLIQNIKKAKPRKGGKPSGKAEEKPKNGENPVDLECGMCKKKFKGNQVQDEAIRFDNPEWVCPSCEHQQLLIAVKEIFVYVE